MILKKHKLSFVLYKNWPKNKTKEFNFLCIKFNYFSLIKPTLDKVWTWRGREKSSSTLPDPDVRWHWTLSSIMSGYVHCHTQWAMVHKDEDTYSHSSKGCKIVQYEVQKIHRSWCQIYHVWLCPLPCTMCYDSRV